MELPTGILIESRKGSSDVLSTMASDFATLSTSGYLKTERRTSSGLDKTGYLVFADGEPIIAIHEANGITQGIDALLEIEADSVIIDCELSAVELNDDVVSEIRRLYKDASLALDDGIAKTQDNWWMGAEIDNSSWARPERLPDYENIITAPEEIQEFTRAMLARSDVDEYLDSSKAILVDEDEPKLVFELISLLAVNGKSVFSLARQPTKELVGTYGIPSSNCLRFTETAGEGNIVASLENVNRKFDELLWESERSVICVEGIEYLASLHGENRVLDLLRTMIDKVRNEDHLLLIGCNLSAFDTMFRATISTELEIKDTQTIRSWIALGELITDQPLFQLVDEAESLWIEAELNSALSTNENEEMISMEILQGGSQKIGTEIANEVGKDLTNMMKEWAAESRVASSGVIDPPNLEVPPSIDWEPNFEPIRDNDIHKHHSKLEESNSRVGSQKGNFVNKFVPLPSKKGMRKASIIKRKRRPKAVDSSQIEIRKSGLTSAASKKVEIPEITQEMKVANQQYFSTKEVKIPSSKLLESEVYSINSKNTITQAGKQNKKSTATEFGGMDVNKSLDVVHKISTTDVDYIALDSGIKKKSKYSRSESSNTSTEDPMTISQNNWNSMTQPAKTKGDSNE